MIAWSFLLASMFALGDRNLKQDVSRFTGTEEAEPNFILKAVNFLWQPGQMGYHHVWPVIQISVCFLLQNLFREIFLCIA